jgi:hypothetical protein
VASATLRESLDVVADALTGSRDATYTRSAALFDRAERRLEQCSSSVGPDQLAIRDLKLIDGTMAGVAGYLGLRITDYDTQPATSGGSGGIPVSGRVHTTGGGGVGFAALTLIDPRGRQVTRAVADADGGYQFDAPAPGAYVLLTSAGSHRPAASTVIVRERPGGSGTVVNVLLADTGVRGDEEARADAELAGYARLSGRILTKADAQPVPGARVTLLDTTGAAVAVAEADESGQYAFDGLADGEYTALASSFPPAASSLRITASETTIRHDIELKQVSSEPNGVDVSQAAGTWRSAGPV